MSEQAGQTKQITADQIKTFRVGMTFDISHCKLNTPGLASPVSVIAKTIEQKVIEVIAKQMRLDPGDISRETEIYDDLKIDSLDCVETVMELEDEFDISIVDEDAEKLTTVSGIVDLVAETVAARNP